MKHTQRITFYFRNSQGEQIRTTGILTFDADNTDPVTEIQVSSVIECSYEVKEVTDFP